MIQIVKNFLRKSNTLYSEGQTLIETMVAVFILVMGVTAATGLAVFALGTSTNVTKQIIATGLAREGIEALKNMRDTNWLKGTLGVNQCYNFATSQNNQADCYTDWLQPSGSSGTAQKAKTVGFDMSYGASGTLMVGVDPDPNNRFWRYNNISCAIGSAGCGWGLDFNADPIGNVTGGFYYHSQIGSNGEKHGDSDYYRKITINQYTTAPYDQANLLRLDVTAQVWWQDKKCPRARDWSEASPACRLELRTFLTNWKNY